MLLQVISKKGVPVSASPIAARPLPSTQRASPPTTAPSASARARGPGCVPQPLTRKCRRSGSSAHLVGAERRRAGPPGVTGARNSAQLRPGRPALVGGTPSACACVPAWPPARKQGRGGNGAARRGRARSVTPPLRPCAQLAGLHRGASLWEARLRTLFWGPSRICSPASREPRGRTHHVRIPLQRRFPVQVSGPAAVQADERATAIVAGELAICREACP